MTGSGRLQQPSGLLVVDKPAGPTSMDVCRMVRARLRAGGARRGIRVGHGGTLDPLATGVLVVLVGAATRRSREVMALPKRYLACIDLSRRSTTDDLEGEVEWLGEAEPPAPEAVAAACARFVGTIEQVPPAYSAVKLSGRRAYALARRGEAPKPAARRVTIHALTVVAYAWPKLTIELRCGSGTYVRSVARDLGASLGVYGMVEWLRRTAVGPWTIDRATPLGALPAQLGQGDLQPVEPGCEAGGEEGRGRGAEGSI